MRRRRKTSEGNLVVALFLGVISVSLMISIAAVLKVWAIGRELEGFKRRVYSDLSERVERLERMLGPDSPLSEYIVDVNFIKNALEDVDTIEKALTEKIEDTRSAYFRILVIGQERVWVSISKDGKSFFADNCLPGLLPYKFYYFKPPNVQLDYVKVVPSDASITVGKPNRVFLIFFGVGSGATRPVKIVKLSEKYYRSLKDDFKLYIPQ